MRKVRKNEIRKESEGCGSVVECFARSHESMHSIQSTGPKRRKKGKKKWRETDKEAQVNASKRMKRYRGGIKEEENRKLISDVEYPEKMEKINPSKEVLKINTK